MVLFLRSPPTPDGRAWLSDESPPTPDERVGLSDEVACTRAYQTRFEPAQTQITPTECHTWGEILTVLRACQLARTLFSHTRTICTTPYWRLHTAASVPSRTRTTTKQDTTSMPACCP